MILPKYTGKGSTVGHIPDTIVWQTQMAVAYCDRTVPLAETTEEQPEEYCSECLEALDGQ